MKKGNWFLWSVVIAGLASSVIMMMEMFIGATAMFFGAAIVVLISGLVVAFTKQN